MDAGDAVQGNVMGTLTQGQALVDIMNATGYDYVIPGNHEFDYGMPQFNHLVGSANATYLSCNFTDKRPEVPTLMFAPYAIQDYPLADGSTARVAFVGVTTPASMAIRTRNMCRSCKIPRAKTSSSRKRARSSPAWVRSLSIRTAAPSPPARPPSRPRFCARPAYVQEATFGRDANVRDAINKKVADVEAQTGTVIGKSEVDLYAFKDDDYTWAVRAHETNLGDFVCDAYLYYATNAGVMADIAFVNGGGVRANLNRGNVTKGDLINVNPFNNQLCYTSVSGQDLLDALELSASSLPESNGDFLQVSEGLEFVIRTDIDSPVLRSGSTFVGIDDAKERRVRRAKLHSKAIDPQAAYTLVCHSYYLVEGGGSYSMLCKNPVTLLGLDNDALMEYVQLNLRGVIGQQYANATGQGRIATQVGPDPDPDTDPDPTPKPEPEQPEPQPPANDASDPKPLAPTGDDGALEAGAAAVAAAAAVGAAAFATAHAETEDERA